MCVSSIWIELKSISALSLINGSYHFRCEVCIVTVLGKIGEASPVGCTHGKAAQRSTKDQVAWLHLRPCLAPPWRGSQQNYQRLLWTVRYSESPRAMVLNPFHTSYPFLKQDYQIFPQFTQRCWVIENTKLTNYFSLDWFIEIDSDCNLWFSKFTPRVHLPQVKNHCLRAIAPATLPR